MKLYTEVPRDNNELHQQTELSDMTGKDFMALFEPAKPSLLMKFYRFSCFLLFLGPIKIFLTILIWILIYALILILPLFKRFFKTPRSFKAWACQITRPFSRLALLFLGITKINLHGNIHPDARTIVSNHLSLIETLLFLNQFPVSYLAASYLEKVPFIRNASEIFDFLFVDRSRRQNITQHLIDITNDPSVLPVVVFPEGKVTNGDALVGFRSGAYVSETLVQPIAIRYKLWFTPRTMSTISWNEDVLLIYLYQLYCIPFITVDIDCLEPISWKGTNKTPKERARESEIQIANHLGTLACSKTNKELFTDNDEPWHKFKND